MEERTEMKKRLFVLLLVLLLPLTALAELEYTRETKKFINFPTLDGFHGHFTKVNNWTIVTADNLDEHMERMLRRGDTEEEIRARFEEETLVFEAYCDDLPEDACFRFERFESEMTREVWHVRHLDTAARKKLISDITSGYVFPHYDVYSINTKGSGDNSYLQGWFTNFPPARLESGKIQMHFRNGVMYVLSYNVCGRLVGSQSLLDSVEEKQIGYTPLDMETSFKSKALPKPAAFTLDKAFPTQVDPGERTVTGSIRQGGGLTVTIDGASVPVKLDSKGKFTVTLPLTDEGDHEIVFTATHSKHTDNVNTYTVNVSDSRTQLNLTAKPERFATVGKQKIAGTTDPGARVTLQLDGEEPITLIADEKGGFTYTYDLPERAIHELHLTAVTTDTDLAEEDIVFVTVYEDVEAGIKDFQKELTSHSINEIIANPDSYIGEKVKISVRVKEIQLTEDGLGILCTYNVPKNYKYADEPLYVAIRGYAQCQVRERMIITVYATVKGTCTVVDKDGVEETRLGFQMEFGTYLR